MKTDELALAYLEKASVRLEALDFYRERQAYSDVVREAQTVVELTLKALLRVVGVEVPKVHDVGRSLEDNRDLLPTPIVDHLTRIRSISKRLRKELELSMYGTDDFVPTAEYDLADADLAIEEAGFVLDVVRGSLARGESAPRDERRQ